MLVQISLDLAMKQSLRQVQTNDPAAKFKTFLYHLIFFSFTVLATAHSCKIRLSVRCTELIGTMGRLPTNIPSSSSERGSAAPTPSFSCSVAEKGDGQQSMTAKC